MIETIPFRGPAEQAEDVICWITRGSGNAMRGPGGTSVPFEPSPRLALLLSSGLSRARQLAESGRGPWPYMVTAIGGAQVPIDPYKIFFDPGEQAICVQFHIIGASVADVNGNANYEPMDAQELMKYSGLAASPANAAAKNVAQASGEDSHTVLDNSGTDLPDNLQWMPPGMQSIVPSIGGVRRAMTINVNPALATKLNLQLQTIRHLAAKGLGDEAYIDFNHDDRERAAEVLELYWGGDDPKTGGIRARVNWSAAGIDAVLGRNYRRFSPQWEVNPATNEPAGIGCNLGGLVNRAAFRTIAPVIAKASAGEAAGRSGPTRAIEHRTDVVLASAQEYADKKGVSLVDAIRREMRRNPGFDHAYRNSIVFANGGAPKRVVKLPEPVREAHNEFMEAAQAHAEAYRVPLAQAIQAVARQNPKFYSDYRKSVVGS